jgi:hypothetical protein
MRNVEPLLPVGESGVGLSIDLFEKMKCQARKISRFCSDELLGGN